MPKTANAVKMSTPSRGASDRKLVITRVFDAPREKVFNAWTDPRALKTFMKPTDTHTIPEVEVDPRTGGRYRIVIRSPKGETHVAFGTYREIVPPEKLVCTWSWEKAEKWTEIGETVLTLEFRVKGKGTELTLTHEGFPLAEAKDAHLAGWTRILVKLKRFIEKK